MTMLIKTLAAVTAGTVLATSAFAQSAREVRSPLVAIENEPAPKLVVEPPLPGPLARGAVLIPTGWRTCASYRCSERAPSTYLHGSGICT
jgi:Family of unknown function (DUF6130)